MGRLQKKKTSAQKKKKKKTGTTAAGATQHKKSAVVSKPSGDLKVVKKQSAGMAKPAVVTKSTVAKTEPNIIQKSIQFLREVKVELKKVTWPSRKQTMGSTAVVIVLVIIIALFLGLVDLGLSNIIRLVLN